MKRGLAVTRDALRPRSRDGIRCGGFANPRQRYLAGFWQREEYFSEIADVIRKEFTFREPPDAQNAETLREIATSGNAVCVHVRRGDYLEPQMHAFFGLCGLDYYRQAMELMRGRVNGPRFFLFSDDPAWARGHLHIDDRTRLVDHNVGGQDHEDLRLMAACRHFIIANSSFSWWGGLAECRGREDRRRAEDLAGRRETDRLRSVPGRVDKDLIKHETRIYHGHHRPGRQLPGGIAAGQGLRGPRGGPALQQLQHGAHRPPLPRSAHPGRAAAFCTTAT